MCLPGRLASSRQFFQAASASYIWKATFKELGLSVIELTIQHSCPWINMSIVLVKALKIHGSIAIFCTTKNVFCVLDCPAICPY